MAPREVGEGAGKARRAAGEAVEAPGEAGDAREAREARGVAEVVVEERDTSISSNSIYNSGGCDDSE
jgi:hypothetical protein